MAKVDFLIVGAGLFGAVFAREATDKGYTCLVIDKREHIAGNCYTDQRVGVNVHMFGPHIFHTASKKIWDYVNQFSAFNTYRHSAVANYRNTLYSLPFNMWTFNQFWGVRTPQEAKEIIAAQRFTGTPTNLEEQALSMVGTDIYETLVKGYTTKQWRADPKTLPAAIIKRLPVRYTYDTNYFFDPYQGIPVGGYTALFKNLLTGVRVELGTTFADVKNKNIAKTLVFTGPIDQYYDYCHGRLQYRTLAFEHTVLATDNFQGHSTVNYTDAETPYTRIVEHKHFENSSAQKTVITKEYPVAWTGAEEPMYPINDAANSALYGRYRKIAQGHNRSIIFGGRLAEYKYYDMHQVVAAALHATEKLQRNAKCLTSRSTTTTNC